MSEDIATQITRIDERIKSIKEEQLNLERNISVIQASHTNIMQKIAVLESKDADNIKRELTEVEKRLTAVESSTCQSKDRWNKIFTFMIQIIWVILAAWLLMKLGLQAPAVP